MHLTSVAAVLPDAALEAARLETLHLLSQALDLITRALGFPPPPGQPRQRASDRIRPEDVDVDAEYERNVKPLYGAIVEFLSKARVDADADSVASFFGVRSACRRSNGCPNSSGLLRLGSSRRRDPRSRPLPPALALVPTLA